VLVDGLIASPSAGALRPHLGRLSVVVLLHMPLAPGHPDASVSEHEVVTAARGVIVTSRWTRDHVIAGHRLRDDRVWVAVPGAPPSPVALGGDDGRPGRRLLHVGPLAQHKGGDVLAAALGRLAALDWEC